MSRKQKQTPAPKASQAPRGPVVTHDTSRCPKCESTRRSDYTNTRRHDYAGLTEDGKPYTVVVWRNTTCLDCGQMRTDRTLEFEPELQEAASAGPS